MKIHLKCLGKVLRLLLTRRQFSSTFLRHQHDKISAKNNFQVNLAFKSWNLSLSCEISRFLPSNFPQVMRFPWKKILSSEAISIRKKVSTNEREINFRYGSEWFKLFLNMTMRTSAWPTLNFQKQREKKTRAIIHFSAHIQSKLRVYCSIEIFTIFPIHTREKVSSRNFHKLTELLRIVGQSFSWGKSSLQYNHSLRLSCGIHSLFGIF